MSVSASYFTGELLIPAKSGTTYAEVENLSALTMMIAKYEPKFLKLLLGEELYVKYVAGMALEPTSGIWFDLNAQIYQEDNPVYTSPVANYVYFYFWRTYSSTTLASGEMVAKFENGDNVGMYRKMIDAWNEMCDLAEEIQEWIEDNSTDYPDWGTEEHTIFAKINIYGC